MKAKLFIFANRMLKNAVVIKAGLLISTVIIFFKIISLFVLFQYIRFDVYLCMAAAFFFAAGVFLNKSKVKQDEPPSPQPNVLLLLSAKEIQIFTLVAEGKTNKEIAAIHFIEVSTVKTHINNIYTKLSVTNRKEARVKYQEVKNRI